MSTTDLLIALPLVPLAPILITWYLPWEQWINWGRVPKYLLGPYLLYAAFAAWHFKFGWFVTSVAAIFGIGVSVAGIYAIAATSKTGVDSK